jgi:hypothetical protein
MRRASVSLLLLIIFGQVAAAQDKQATDREKIASYLRNYLAEYNNRPHSLHNRFSGEFVPMPEEPEKSLLKTFPRHRFTIAKTYFSHWGPDDGSANIILITDAVSGEVVAHQWALNFSDRASESFYQFLGGYPPASRQDALDKVKVLSSLMFAGLVRGSVGKVRFKGNTITSELLWWGEPWRILKVGVGKDMKFSRITIINSRMGNVVN